MKIAIFHSFLDNIGGSEILTLHLARGLGADIYTTNINEDNIKKMGFNDLLEKRKIKSIGKVPIQAPFRQQAVFMKFRKLNLSGKYDFYIISGDWAIGAAVNNKPNMEYFHSPLNEVWAFRDELQKSLPFWKKPIYLAWTEITRFFYKRYFKHVQKKICNSQNTFNRIKKYLHYDAKIIYPPVDISKYQSGKSEDFWLSVNRLLPHKRVEIQLEAFSDLSGENLVIIGSYEKKVKHFEEYVKSLNEIVSSNVKFLSWVDDKALAKFYSQCKGFITTAEDEDFGMTAIEAMAAGKPVIAPNDGGYKESLLNEKTGILIDNINPDKIVKAVKKIEAELKENPRKYEKACKKQAEKFDVKNFIKKIKEEIER